MTALMISLTIFTNYLSANLTNTWCWLPPGGVPAQYQVQKTTDGGTTWEDIGKAPHELVDYEGQQVIMFEYTSTKEEDYQIRVCALDANNRAGPWSDISDILEIRIRPAQPKLMED